MTLTDAVADAYGVPEARIHSDGPLFNEVRTA